MDEQVNLKTTMPLLVGYRMVRVVDDKTKQNIVALYKVHLDSEGKVWGLVGQPIFLAKDTAQLDKSIQIYMEELQEGYLQAQLMQAAAVDGGIHTRESFPEPGATNPLAYMDPLGQADGVPEKNEDLDNVR